MSNLKEVLSGKKVLIPFITCGDPDLETTEKAVLASCANGADAIILGMPFSDPTAEGPVVYEANLRALASGITTDKIIEAAKRYTSKVNVPIMFMTYANVVFSYGIERFASECRDAGVAGVTLFDLPFEEKDEFESICSSYGVDLISFVAPAPDARIAKIAKEAKGIMFIMGAKTDDEIKHIVKVTKENSSVPCICGFDDLTAQEAKTKVLCSDGVALCTDLVKIIERFGKNSQVHIANYVKSINDAIRS